VVTTDQARIRVAHREHFLTEAHHVEHAMVGGDLTEVLVDLLAGGEHPREVGVRSERVRVHVRRHVARDARIGVLAPGAAEVVGLLETGDVGDARLPQPDDGEDARHARSDHGHSQRSRWFEAVTERRI
jgi:hypothetical protein